MSATIPNLSEIALWLKAALYITTFRPVEIKEFIKFGPDIISTDGVQIVRRLK
jgi:DNA polymerase theta